MKFDPALVLEEIKRRINGRTQKELAKELGISGQYLSDVMRRRRLPSDRIMIGLGFELRVCRKKKQRMNGA